MSRDPEKVRSILKPRDNGGDKRVSFLRSRADKRGSGLLSRPQSAYQQYRISAAMLPDVEQSVLRGEEWLRREDLFS